MPTLKIDHARYILTVDPERRIIRDGTIVVDGQRITHLGKAAELAEVRAERTIEASGMVVTPAFTNGHMHISYAHAVRGIFPDDHAGPSRLLDVFRLQSQMTEQEEYYTSLLAIIELLKGGTVTLVDPGSTRYLDACLQVYEQAGCRVITGEQQTDRAGPMKLPRYSTDEALARAEQLIKRYDGRLDGRLRAWAMPFSLELCSGELLTGLKRLADHYGTGLTMHHSSSPDRAAHAAQHGGLSPTAYLESLGVLGPNVLLAHVAGLDDDQVDCLARTNTNVAICPSNALKQAQGLGDRKLPELLERGVNVALGSDSANSSNYLDMVRTLNIAAVGFKDARRDLKLVPAEQAVEMATLLGARAVGLGDEIGSVEVGKKADLLLFDTRRAEWSALLNPVNNLVYNAAGGSLHTVVSDGRIVLENGAPTFADEGKIADKVQELGEAFLARVGAPYPLSRWPVV